MSTSYTFSLTVGYRISSRALLAPYAQKSPERFHMEDRYDPKTGQKLKPVKVIDQEEYESYVLDGEEIEEYEIGELIGKKLNKKLSVKCVFEEDGYDDLDFIIGPDLGKIPGYKKSFVDYGNVEAGGTIPFAEFTRIQEQLELIRAALGEFGITVGEPEVTIAHHVG